MEQVDAVVIGAGHHGLVAAATLADAGWDVLVLEERDVVGGAVASVVEGEWIHDEFSACHPLAKASPVLQALDLEDHSLKWAQAPKVLAHLGLPDTAGAALFLQAEQTAAALDAEHPGDGQAWLDLVTQWDRIREPLLAALLTRWPPVRDAARLVTRLGVRDTADLARLALQPVNQLAAERFGGTGGPQLLAGNAMHADIPAASAGSGLYGWVMTMLAQDVGFPSPVGGSKELARALRSRAEAAGAKVETGVSVQRIRLRGNRVHGVETTDGRQVRVRRAVVADTSAPVLYEHLLDPADVPAGLRRRMGRFSWDLPTVKLNYSLSAPVPWTDLAGHGAAVIHAGQDMPGVIRWSADLESGHLPERPFALMGQMTTIDQTRSPAGTEVLWLYTHLPRSLHADAAAATQLIERSEDMIESLAPGFRDVVMDRWEQTPHSLQDSNSNLGRGAVGGGTQQLFQQAIWRPVTGLGGPRTFVDSLYLGSAAIHPGGGVHGGCGYLAARAALQDSRWWGLPVRKASLGALHRLYSE